MRYLLTGGGTGGHVYPNLAIAAELARRDPAAVFLYVGVRGRAEADIVPRRGMPIRFVPARGMPDKKYSPAMLVFLLATFAGLFKALVIILRFRPALVVGTGGYVSAPVLLAARLLRRRTIVHEQNAYPGLVNRTIGKLADRVCVTFPESMAHFRHNGKIVGYPVRPDILARRAPADEATRRAWKAEQGIDPDRRLILVTGGSLGARSINRAVADMMPLIAADPARRDRLFVLHAVGRFTGKEYDAARDTTERLAAHGFDEAAASAYYRRETYLYDIEKWLGIADVVVCRAGAGSLAETMALGVPAVVIPKSGLPGDHQVKNAETMAAGGACLVVQEKRAVEGSEAYDAVDARRLLAAVDELLDLPPERRDAMRAAAERFVVVDSLTRIGEEAARLLAPPQPKSERIRRRRVFLVVPDGARHELLFDRSRVGTARWDDVRLAVPGLRPRHFWLKRMAQRDNGTIIDKWVVIARHDVLVQPAGADAPQSFAGPHPIDVGDRLVLPNGAIFEFAAEWTEVSRDQPLKGVVENVFSQGVGTLAAKLIGFVREAFIGRFFGASAIMDVFAVALSLANLMREVVAEMALENAFLPTFRLFYGRSDDKQPAWRLAWQVFNVFFLLSVAIAVVGILTCPWWIAFIAPGFVAKGLITPTIAMTRLMFPFLILMSVSAFLGTILQSFDRFGPNAFAPVLYSIALVACVPIFEPFVGMYALGVAVLVGGAAQVAFQLAFMLRRGMREKIAWRAYRPVVTGEPGVKKVLSLSGPVFADAMLNKISGIVDKILATPLVVGSVSALYFARLLVVFPFSVLAMSVNRVFLRDLSDEIATGDARRYRDMLRRGIEATVLLILPTTAVLVALASPLVRFVFEGGRFTAHDTSMTSMALVCYSLGLLGWSLTSLYSRVFSSQLDTRTSMMTNFGSLFVYLALAFVLVKTPLAHAGLALATSVGFTFNTVWRHRIIARRLEAEGAPLRWTDLAPTVGKTLLASAVTVLVTLLLFVPPGPDAGFLAKSWAFIAPASAAVVVFVLFGYLLRISPFLDLLNYFAARLGMGRPFGAGPLPHANGNGNVRTLSAAGLVAEAGRREFDAGEMRVVRDRLETFLGHDDWWIRNLGVKLIGALGLDDKIDVLVDAISAKDHGRSRLRRFLRGAGRDVGFVRRNALTSLVEIGVFDARVRRAILTALGDPYYEVRLYALRTAIAFAEQLRGDVTCLGAVAGRLEDRHFEVVPVAVRAYAELAVAADAWDRLRPLLDDPRWPVRAAAADAGRRLYDRELLSAPALRADLGRILLAGEMVEPVSPLKRAVLRALEHLPKE